MRPKPGAVAVTRVADCRNNEPAIAQRRCTVISMLLIILVVVLLLGALPAWPYSRGWGYYPSGTLGAVLLIVLILVLLGRI